MVMEAPPSPQSVGREFVRQYYTLLNKAPTHLHRFYNNQSSFVHGGLDPPNRETSPVIGQKQIHQKIQQLNFRDCHAKITQVDAQATLGNGVVVQVTGELSNAGQPMRRFTQTFVLAAQSPKKYYVHNDIFRYQDEIVSDDECEPESRSEIEDELVQERPVLTEVSQIAQQPIPYYNPNSATLQPNLTPVPPHHGQPATTLAHVLPAQPVATINGSLHPDELNAISAGQLSPAVPSVQGQSLGAPIANLQSGITSANPLTTSEENRPVTEEPTLDTALDNNYAMNQDVLSTQELNQDTSLSNEPKTYATLLKSGSGTAAYSGVTAPVTVFNQPPKSLSPPLTQSHFENRDVPPATSQVGNQSSGSLGQRMGVNRGPRNNQQPRIPRQDSRSGKNSFNDDGSGYDDRRKSQSHRDTSFGDSHQLFLGNLPHSATEEELREIFSAFGPIVDLRIQPSTKGSSSGPRAPPNYGFITYENQQAVQNCLAAKPIRYPNNDKNGTVLNVEEKKTKDRLPYGGNRGGSDNMGGPRSRDNGPRRPGTARGGGGPTGGPGGRPNNFNRPPPNRSSNNTYTNRR
ncbi:hypothetical protein ILUMI_08543 [Ignelater luminosus]|uniref:Ras GTPase-activating protein-binding protein 2 n=1 Tax=Ignelater luminosus TaxID=2038154 RepID=A0A8K0GFU9_IGNLU|nr:hypothetical protein ILUMI_08543 [Ignelater luminosus]